MSDLFSISAKIIPIDGDLRSIPKSLVHKLIQFTDQYYIIDNAAIFVDKVLRPKQPGEIIIFYGEADEIVGYTRIYIQQLDVRGRLTTIYSANSYKNQTHDTSFAAARCGLIQTMKYKLSHPDEELVNFSLVNNPSKYQFLARLSNTIYPKPGSSVPNHILSLVNQLKENNHWKSCSTHPMLISEQLPLKHSPPSAETITDDELRNYYLSLNPDYAAGRALLVYIPLDLGNIGYSIRQILTHEHDHDHLHHPVIERVGV